MGLTRAVGHVLSNYATFSGRASRAEFWWWYFVVVFVGGIFTAVAMLWSTAETGGYVWGLYLVFLLATFLPSLGVAFRRLHDTNRSGWWLLMGVLPIVGGFLLLVMYALPGTPGDNAYGPPPEQM